MEEDSQLSAMEEIVCKFEFVLPFKQLNNNFARGYLCDIILNLNHNFRSHQQNAYVTLWIFSEYTFEHTYTQTHHTLLATIY